MSTEQLELAQLLQVGARLLDPAGTTTLTPLRELRPGRVLRCRVDSNNRALPATVVVKLRVVREARRPWDSDPVVMENETTGLELANRIAPQLAAKLIAADVNAGVLILEDVQGPATHSLAALLLGRDADAAAAALVAYAAALGTLHGRTLGRQPRPDANSRITRMLRNSADGTEAWILGMNMSEAAAGLDHPVELVGFSVTDGVRAELETMIDLLARPGQYLAFTQGDPDPANVTFGRQGIRFFDFEWSAFRHCLLDAEHFHTFSSGPIWRRLPHDLTEAMEAAYKTSLPPDLTEPAKYNPAAAAAATAWVVGFLVWFLPFVVAADDTRQHQRALSILRTYSDRLNRLGRYADLQQWTTALRIHLEQQWHTTADAASFCPAFGGPPISAQEARYIRS